jgi:hypothetical protein
VTKFFGKLLFALMTLISCSAGATVVNFEGFSPLETKFQTIVDTGFTFTNLNTTATRYGLYGWKTPLEGADNGSNLMLFSGNHIQVSADNGTAFNLDSLDLGLSWYLSGVSSAQVTLLGHLSSGGTSFSEYTITPVFNTFSPGWSNLLSLEVSVTGALGYVALDNLQVTAVPEPGIAWMLLSGLLAAGSLARRRA